MYASVKTARFAAIVLSFCLPLVLASINLRTAKAASGFPSGAQGCSYECSANYSGCGGDECQLETCLQLPGTNTQIWFCVASGYLCRPYYTGCWSGKCIG